MVSFCLPPQPDEPDVQVVAKWRNGTVSLTEIVAIRRLLPTVRDWPLSRVFAQARASSGWVLTVTQPAHARRAVQEAERVGLLAVVEPFSADQESYEQCEARWGCTVPPSWWPG
jgi:hypothetical protein